jgi:hypothetical protein
LSDPTKAAIILIISIGLVISYPTLMYPPIRNAIRRAIFALGWPFRAIGRVRLSIAQAPGQWVRLQKEILRLAELAESREQELTEAAGRMWLETQVFPHKPKELIRNADRNHGILSALHSELIAETFGRPVSKEAWFQKHEKAFRMPPRDDWWQVDLWFTWAVWRILAAVFVVTYAGPRRIPPFRVRTNRRLSNLLMEWRSLTRRQARLRGLIEKVPERTKLYDQQESAKELESQQQEVQDAMLRPLKTAEVALEGAKGYLKRLQVRRQDAPTKGSAVLSLELVANAWQARIHDIEQAQAEKNRPMELIRAIRSLERDMALTGTYAARVVRVERRAQQIQSLHKRLKRRSRGQHLPDEELKVITIAMRDVVSQLWVEARWDELTDVLDRTLENIRTYETVVLSRVWHLKAGTFEQLLKLVFQPGYTAATTEMRFNPQVDAQMKKAADGSSKLSPFAERVQEYADGDESRFATR